MQLMNIDPVDLDKMSDEEVEALWGKMNPVKTFTKFNAIRVDNNKMTSDGKEINSDFGKIFRIEFETDDKGELQEVRHELPVGTQLFPVLQRVQVQCDWVADDKGVRKPLYSIEESNVGDPVNICDPTTKALIESGYYKELKDKYGLKYAQTIYFYLPEKEKVYRWDLKGGTLSNWFNLAPQKNPTFVEIAGITEESSPAGMFWNTVKFAYGEAFPVRKAITLQAELSRALRANAPVEESAPTPAATMPPIAMQAAIASGMAQTPGAPVHESTLDEAFGQSGLPWETDETPPKDGLAY